MMKGRAIMLTMAAVCTASLCAAQTPQPRSESLSYAGQVPQPGKEPIAWGRDPFAQPGKRAIMEAGAPALSLTAIFYNPERPSAIINERIVYKGMVIKGQKVIDIGKTHVILQGEGGAARLDIAGNPAVEADGGRRGGGGNAGR
ncbi:MAG: hypothetical protein HY894_01410 [Deltaproteobacteria bacterium]|nr:hypothetical protein [Deltaproteobacteria bacterium]